MFQPNLFKKLNYPYYVVAPGYDHKSGGNKVMHYLCHALNLAGEKACMITNKVNPELRTPYFSFKEEFTIINPSIAVYPELGSGNPVGSAVVVRYILSERYNMILYDHSDIIYSFSPSFKIKEAVGILELPVVDPSVFYKDDKVEKTITTFYLGRNEGCTLNEITKNSTQITKDWPPTPKEVADLLRKSKIFYTYVATGLGEEALLCGTPVVVIPNEKYNEKTIYWGNHREGIAWGIDKVEIERAVTTLEAGRQRVLNRENIFWGQLKEFISYTQKRCSLVA